MYYRLVFKRNAKYAHMLKILLLIAGLFCDFATILGLVFAVLGAYLYLVMMFSSLAFGILFRVVAIKLVFDIECRLDDGKLVLSKIYPNKTQEVFSEKLGDIKVEVCDENNEECRSKLCENKQIINLATSKKQRYLIANSTKCVICNLDKYIYACILNGEEI